MAKVIAIVGCTAVGKDLVLNSVLEKSNFKPVISHTSRPIRNGEKEGKEYHFISSDKAVEMRDNNEFIECRNYNVVNNEMWIYGVHKDSIDINSNDTYIAIVDYQGLIELERYLKENNVECISFYVQATYQNMLQRSLSRQGNMSNDEVLEVVRRFNDDLLNVAPAKFHCNYILCNDEKIQLELNTGFIIKKGTE